MRLILLVLLLAVYGCGTSTSSQATRPPITPPGAMLLYLPVTPGSTTPPPGETGLTQWAVQMNAVNSQYPYIVYEQGYAGNFTLASSCAGDPNRSATAVLSPNNIGPGVLLIVTSASTVTRATCVFAVTDASAQKISLSVGFP